jgi:solute carrier family 35 protein F5
VTVSSFVGLFNTIFLLPLIPILSVMGKGDLIVCAINMVITLSSDYLYVLAMLKTTPLGECWRPS